MRATGWVLFLTGAKTKKKMLLAGMVAFATLIMLFYQTPCSALGVLWKREVQTTISYFIMSVPMILVIAPTLLFI